MLQFNKNSAQCLVVMYPSGGYGNFLYYLLTQHFEQTVKLNNKNFKFSDTGNSHNVTKYCEIFALGPAYNNKNLKNFNYSYQVFDQYYLDQINQGKKFVVLADMGILGDNIAFLQRYFPQATVLRVFANTFEEKLVLWANCISKAYASSEKNQVDPVYKTSLHTVDGIAKFANKPRELIDDQDAIDCTINFFKNNFEIYGKMFRDPVDGAVNIPYRCFFSHQGIVDLCRRLEQELNLRLIDQDQLHHIITNFLPLQKSFQLLNSNMQNDYSIVSQALQQWKKN
jgi:hypothetical protein